VTEPLPTAPQPERVRPLGAPQQAAEPLLRQLEPQAHDARFLRIALCVWLALVLATAAAAVVLDPTGAFGARVVPPLVWQDCDQKAGLFLAREPRPQLVVLGSSHMMKMSPRALRDLTGRRAFNFAVGAARPEDLRAILRFVDANGAGALDRVLIGVDAEMFRNDEQRGRLLAASHHLRRYAASGAPSRIASLGHDLLSSDIALLALRSAKVNLWDGGSPPGNFAIQADGFIDFVRWEAEAAAGHPTVDERVSASIREFRNWYAAFTALDPVRVDDLRALLAEARERGVLVDAFMPPLHARLLRSLERSSHFVQRRRETARLLGELAGVGLLRLHPVDTLESFDGDPAGFYDGEHMDEANSTRLLTRIYGADAKRAVQ
jgi:hypothetical protein